MTLMAAGDNEAPLEDASPDAEGGDMTTGATEQWGQNLTRLKMYIGLLMVLGVLWAMLFFARTLLQQSLEGYGCLGCKCLPDDEFALFTVDVLDDAHECPPSGWQPAGVGLQSAVDTTEQLKIVEKCFLSFCAAVFLLIVVVERLEENKRVANFRLQHAAGLGAVRGGDGMAAAADFKRCLPSCGNAEEYAHVAAQIANSEILHEQKTEGDQHREAGEIKNAVYCYQLALDAAPECDVVRQALEAAEAEHKQQLRAEQLEHEEKAKILSAAPIKEALCDAHSLLLPRLTSEDSDRAAAAAQLGQLQAALESEAASRGEAGRWRIVACKEFSELAAVVVCDDSKLKCQHTVKALFAPGFGAGWQGFPADTVQHLQHQADLLRVINHDRIARLVETFFVAFDNIFVAFFEMLETADAETLDVKLERGGCMSAHDTCNMALDAVRGLGYLHERGLVHAALKPGVVVLVKGSWKLHIWSLIRVPSSGSLNSDQLGACHYLAPEAAAQMRAEDVDARSDLYSLGAIMFQALAGKLPVADGETVTDRIINAVRFSPAPDVRDVASGGAVSDSVAALVTQTLQKDSFARHPDAPSMEAALTDALMMSGLAEFDVFISYRVRSEAEFATALHEKLSRRIVGINSERCRVYLDKVELKTGAKWDDGFVQGLSRSKVFVPLMSLGSTEPIAHLDDALRSPAVDNVLLEWNLALRLNELGVVKAILPVLLGKEDGNGARPDSFFADGSNGGGRPFPGRAHQPTAEKEFHYLGAWEEKMALQAEGESGIGEAELVALSAQLGRPMSEAQARDALLAMEMGPTVDSATFLQ